MNITPLVSICIPTRNGDKYIGEALDSAIKQTYRPIEIIVSDDQSSDNTMKIIEEVTRGWDIPVNIYNHTPTGIGANWNNCVSHANGKYIKFLFQDDLIYPTCISEMVALAEKDKEIGLVFSNRDIIGDTSGQNEWLEKYENLSVSWENILEVQQGKELLAEKGFMNKPYNKIGEPSVVLIRKNCFNNIGFFSEELKQSLDYEYWYRLMTQYKIGYVNKSLAAFRLHAAQATQINKMSSGHKEKYLYYKSLKKYMHLLHVRSRLVLQYRFIKHAIFKSILPH